MPTVEFVTVDVFTAERFTGNPLAVITDARGLTTQQMQRIATEFGYSESTFVLPPEDPANSAHVRIFTPTLEVPFAGHPNVGTAYVLGQKDSLFGKPVENSLRFEEKAGIVEVELKREDNKVAAASIRAPRSLEIGETVAAELVARCVAIDTENVRTDRHAPVFASVGLGFVLAELENLDALGRNLRSSVKRLPAIPAMASVFPCFSMCAIRRDRTISVRACSPRSTTCRKIRRPAAHPERLPPIWSPTCPTPIFARN